MQIITPPINITDSPIHPNINIHPNPPNFKIPKLQKTHPQPNEPTTTTTPNVLNTTQHEPDHIFESEFDYLNQSNPEQSDISASDNLKKSTPMNKDIPTGTTLNNRDQVQVGKIPTQQQTFIDLIMPPPKVVETPESTALKKRDAVDKGSLPPKEIPLLMDILCPTPPNLKTLSNPNNNLAKTNNIPQSYPPKNNNLSSTQPEPIMISDKVIRSCGIVVVIVIWKVEQFSTHYSQSNEK